MVECRLGQIFDGGDHELVTGHVVNMEVRRWPPAPLLPFGLRSLRSLSGHGPPLEPKQKSIVWCGKKRGGLLHLRLDWLVDF